MSQGAKGIVCNLEQGGQDGRSPGEKRTRLGGARKSILLLALGGSPRPYGGVNNREVEKEFLEEV